jgi:ribosomal protein L16/L10AE
MGKFCGKRPRLCWEPSLPVLGNVRAGRGLGAAGAQAAVLRAVQHMLAVEIAAEPRVRRACRQAYRRR